VIAGLRRFGALVATAAAAAALLGLVIAAAGRESIRRGLAIGFYLGGAGLCGLGILLGSRPPVRGKDGSGGFVGFGRWVGGGVRWATRQERDEAINLPALLLSVGIVLILLGVAVDKRTSHLH
jgi:hypothetical protein